MIDAGPDEPGARRSLLSRIGDLLRSRLQEVSVAPSPTPVALNGSVRVARPTQQFQLTLGNVVLEFHLDLPMTGVMTRGCREWIVHSGRAFYDAVPEFQRIRPGETVHFGRADPVLTRIFSFDLSVADRHVRVTNKNGALTIQPLDPDRRTTIAEIASARRVWQLRRENLERLPGILGRPLMQFDDDEALDVVHEVNEILATEAYREPNDDGMPGGILRLPDDKTVVILGDLHTRVNNLLRVIVEGGTLRALERDEACLLLLGDLIHSEEPDELEQMDSSVLVLDLFCMLKRRFPANIFSLRGNHEDFSPEAGKGGVPQGLLFRRYLKKRRGGAYVRQVEQLFDGLAYIAQGAEFAACHGAPARSKVTREALVNIRRYPGLQYEIVWNRLRQAGRLAGYGKGTVKRFRRTLGLSKEATVLVGHTPMSTSETLWQDVGGIKGHHIVYSAHANRLAAVVMRDGQATPLEYAAEPALALLSREFNPPVDALAAAPGGPEDKEKTPPAEAGGTNE